MELDPVASINTRFIDLSIVDTVKALYQQHGQKMLAKFLTLQNRPEELPTSEAIFEAIHESVKLCRRIGLPEETFYNFYVPSIKDPQNPKDISLAGIYKLFEHHKLFHWVNANAANSDIPDDLYVAINGWVSPSSSTVEHPVVALVDKQTFFAGDMSQEEQVIQRAAELGLSHCEYLIYITLKTILLNFRRDLLVPKSKTLLAFEKAHTKGELLSFVGDEEQYKILAQDIINEEIYDYTLIDPDFKAEQKHLESSGSLYDAQEYEMHVAGQAMAYIADSLHMADMLGLPKESFYDLCTPGLNLSKPWAIQMPTSTISRVLKAKESSMKLFANTLAAGRMSVSYYPPIPENQREGKWPSMQFLEHIVKRTKLPDLYGSDDDVFHDELLAAKNLIVDIIDDVFGDVLPTQVCLYD